MERTLRAALILAGLGLGGYGAELLLDQGSANLVHALVWLLGGVVLHDAVLAPVTLLIGLVALRAFRGRLPGTVVIGALVLGSVTLVAVPVLGRFGERADNPTLLDRHYVLGWLVFAILTAAVTALATLLRRRHPEGD